MQIDRLVLCPTILKELLIKIFILDAVTDVIKCCGPVQLAEMFSGGASGRAVSKAWRKHGLRGSDYDLTDNQDHDFTHALGFCLALLTVLILQCPILCGQAWSAQAFVGSTDPLRSVVPTTTTREQ